MDPLLRVGVADMPVLVSHVNDGPNLFYVQHRTHPPSHSPLVSLTGQLANEVFQKLTNPQPRQLCLAKVASDDAGAQEFRVCRGEIKEVFAGDKCSVFLYDYGCTVPAAAAYLTPMPPYANTLPRQAMQCRLAGVDRVSLVPRDVLHKAFLTYTRDHIGHLTSHILGKIGSELVEVELRVANINKSMLDILMGDTEIKPYVQKSAAVVRPNQFGQSTSGGSFSSNQVQQRSLPPMPRMHFNDELPWMRFPPPGFVVPQPLGYFNDPQRGQAAATHSVHGSRNQLAVVSAASTPNHQARSFHNNQKAGAPASSAANDQLVPTGAAAAASIGSNLKTFLNAKPFVPGNNAEGYHDFLPPCVSSPLPSLAANVSPPIASASVQSAAPAAIAKSESATPMEPLSIQVGQASASPLEYTMEALEPEYRDRCFATYIQDPNVFFVLPKSKMDDLVDIMESMEKAYVNVQPSSNQTLTIGAPCAVMQSDGKWYRGRIKGGSINFWAVHLVDAGLTDRFPKEKVCALKAEFLPYPPFAMECQLHNVAPNGIWTQAEIDLFAQMTHGQELHFVVRGETKPFVYAVDLYTAENQHVNLEFVKAASAMLAGVACGVSTESVAGVAPPPSPGSASGGPILAAGPSAAPATTTDFFGGILGQPKQKPMHGAATALLSVATGHSAEPAAASATAAWQYPTLLAAASMNPSPAMPQVTTPSKKFEKLTMEVFPTQSNVRLTHAMSPAKLWLLPLAFATMAQETNDRLMLKYNDQSNDQPLMNLREGEPCCVFDAKNHVWNRGSVVSCNTDGSLSVRLVDIGTLVQAEAADVNQLLPEFFEMPIAVLPCRLQGASDDSAWKPEAVNYFKGMVGSDDLKATFISFDASQDVYEVKLEQVSTQKNLADDLMLSTSALENGTVGAASSDSQQPLEFVVNGLPSLPLKSGDSQKVWISHVDEGTAVIYVQPVDGSKRFRLFEQQLQTAFQGDEAAGGSNVVAIIKGSLVAVKYPEAGNLIWHRGVVLVRSGGDEFQVFLLDYGFVGTFNKHELHPLPPKFRDLPPQAFPCAIKDVSATNAPMIKLIKKAEKSEVFMDIIERAPLGDLKEFQPSQAFVIVKLYKQPSVGGRKFYVEEQLAYTPPHRR